MLQSDEFAGLNRAIEPKEHQQNIFVSFVHQTLHISTIMTCLNHLGGRVEGASLLLKKYKENTKKQWWQNHHSILIQPIKELLRRKIYHTQYYTSHNNPKPSDGTHTDLGTTSWKFWKEQPHSWSIRSQVIEISHINAKRLNYFKTCLYQFKPKCIRHVADNSNIVRRTRNCLKV